MNTSETNVKKAKTTKVIAITVDIKTHERFKKLAKFQGLSIQDAGIQAVDDWIEYVIEHNVKPSVLDLRVKAKLATELIKN